MSRPRRCRRVWFQPNVTYFKPAGIRMIDLYESVITVDAFEAVRLKDLLGLDQETAAKKMNISQPTFHRLLLSARKKIADALVNAKAIRIEGGVYIMPRGDGTGPSGAEPMTGRGMGAGGGMGQGRGQGAGRGRGFGGGFGAGGPPMVCVCPACGNQQPKIRGAPCAQVKCSKCGAFMVRGD